MVARHGRRGAVRTWALGLLAVGWAWGSGAAVAGDPAPRFPAAPQRQGKASVETVYFPNRPQAPVKIVRASPRGEDRSVRSEIVSFGDGAANRVTVVRGSTDPAASVSANPTREGAPARRSAIERVEFAGLSATVTVMRGSSGLRDLFSTDLFGSANAGEFDRIAHAVHGAESSHGTDLRMWRPDPNGPQGPMQVSAAAALDVGGGNRFDLGENRRLGRAYLARMFSRYGNWPDALAAYNWGPGNVDHWIAAGRITGRLPAETVRYIERVLRDALITTVAARRP